MPDIMTIIKNRFGEVLLIVVLYAGMFILVNQIATVFSGQTMESEIFPPAKAFILGMGSVMFAMTLIMLHLGFMASAAKNPGVPLEPAVLLRIGRYFFWRFLRFYLLLEGMTLLVSTIILGVIAPEIFKADLTTPVEALPLATAKLIALFVLIKPILIIPSAMVATNKMLLQSMPYLNRYRLSDLRTVAVPYMLWVIARTVPIVANDLIKIPVLKYTIVGICAVVFAVSLFVMYYNTVKIIMTRERPPEQEQGDEESQPRQDEQ